jgi:hypothetical protein
MQIEKCKYNIIADKHSKLIMGIYLELEGLSWKGIVLLIRFFFNKDNYSRLLLQLNGENSISRNLHMI